MGTGDFWGPNFCRGESQTRPQNHGPFNVFPSNFRVVTLTAWLENHRRKPLSTKKRCFFWLFSKKRIYNNIPRTQMTLGLSWKRVIVLDNYVRCSNSDMSWFLSKAFDLHFRLTFILSGVWIVYFFCVCPTGEIT